MSNAAPVLAQGDILRKKHKSDSDCEKMSIVVIVLAQINIMRMKTWSRRRHEKMRE